MHTKEPWRWHQNTGTLAVRGNRGVCVIHYGGSTNGEQHRAAQANAARIVSCVNALAGLNPDAVADVVAAAEALIQNRDENCFEREEYKQGGKYGDYWSPTASMVNSEHVAALRTALARIRGEG